MSYVSYISEFPPKAAGGVQTIRTALLGNPNCGKTTLFNALTGSNQYVGNWPGVTVEKLEGSAKLHSCTFSIVDLPGTYSLSPCSSDEKVTSDFIKSGGADVIVNVIDASNLERNLFLTMQAIDIGVPMVAVLTFMDELEKQNASVDTAKLSEYLGIPVVPVYYKNQNTADILLESAEKAGPPKKSSAAAISGSGSPYEKIERIIKSVSAPVNLYRPVSRKIDSIVTGKYSALPLFAAIIFFIFAITFGSFGSYLSDAMSYLICDVFAGAAESALLKLSAPHLFTELISSAVIPGVGSVISFLPQLALFFFFISLLEGSGYMARTAFIADGLLEKFGLSGKAVIPMIMGFGCTVPAVMGTRTIDSEKQRRATVLLLPFMSCSAKLPVMLMISSAFFGKYSAAVIGVLYIAGIFSAALSALIFKNTLFRRERDSFILELPPYRMPSLKSAVRQVEIRIRSFLSKAGTTLFALSIALWFLQNFDASLHICTNIEDSILYILGSSLAPLFSPLGFGTWQAAVALIAGLAAKEAVLSTLAILYGFSLSSAPGVIAAKLSCFTPLGALSFLVFVLLYVPCIAAVSTMRKELHSIKWTLFSVLWQISFAYAAALAVSFIGGLAGF